MLSRPNHAKTRMSMMQLVSVAEEAGLNFYLIGLIIPKTHFHIVWLNSKLIILRSAVTSWRARGVAGLSLSKGAALWLQTNT